MDGNVDNFVYLKAEGELAFMSWVYLVSGWRIATRLLPFPHFLRKCPQTR